MHSAHIDYNIPASLGLKRLTSLLEDKLSLGALKEDRVDIVYLDSFDWRLYSKGIVLETEAVDSGSLIYRRGLNAEGASYHISTKSNVDFAWNLPPGRLREELSDILKLRALIPQLKLRVHRYPLQQLNKDEKTVLRASLLDYQVYDPAGKVYKKLGKRLQLAPVRGYDKQWVAARECLERELGLPVASEDVFVLGLNVLHREPAEYNTSVDVLFYPQIQTATATKLLLHRLLDVMQVNEEGILNDIDSEFLHDYRVALRRSRAALKQLKAVFTQRSVEYIQKQLHWLGSMTSPARDMDVYLLKFDSYIGMLPVELRSHLEPLHKLLQEKKRSSYQTLEATLRSVRYRDFVTHYRSFLNTPTPARTSLANARRPLKDVADERIWKAYKKVMREGGEITEQSPPESLHELRISCKKLRYLMEFFQNLYQSESISNSISALKKLQDNLGDFNDLHVQMEKIQEFAEELESISTSDENLQKAMHYLHEHLDALQQEQRNNFHNRFESFSDQSVKACFQNLFKPKKLDADVPA